MGISIFGSSFSVFDKTPQCSSAVEGNPNPCNYKIIKNKTISRFDILLIEYPDCKNYEGKKILVFQNTSVESLKKQGIIDPHFSSNKESISPIARFVPTNEGWKMAEVFCNIMIATG